MIIEQMNIIIVSGSDVYEYRVDRVYDYLLSRGHNVKVITTDFAHMQKKKRECNKPGYVCLKTKPYKKNISVSRIVSHHRYAKDVYKALEDQVPDMLWILVPPNSLVKYLALYKKEHPEVKLVFDIIDMWPETMPVAAYRKLPFIRYWAGLRNKHINSADVIVTECGLYQTVLDKYALKGKMHTLYLTRDRYPLSDETELPEDRISLCYLGSINNIIDIPTINRIIRELSVYKSVVLHIIGDGENKDLLISSAKEAGAEVIYHGKIYDIEEKNRIFSKCNYGLNIMKEDVFIGLTMKSMEYFAAGLPIINNIHGDTWDFVNEYGIGINYIDKSSFENIKPGSKSDVRLFFDRILSKERFEQEADYIMAQIFEPSV